ncbi:hypothetical protein HY493_00105 [Candidatus Woesearchaeota archaeon]|nr:hypothetical protein [Candidatus Woesearchaeota archaeon]
MGFGQALKKIGENLLAGLGGAIVGVIISTIYLLKIWFPTNAGKVGLGIIALIPVMFILFSIVGILIGGISGMVIYHILKSLMKKR